MKLIVTVLCLLSILASCVDPPTYNYAHHMYLDQTFKKDGKSYTINGQVFYDPQNNRQRWDRTNGRYDIFCGGALPNVTTQCQQITKSGKRWIVFPQKSYCCFCCDSQNGCGPLKPDWLKGAQYLGEEQIVDTMYDKWSQDGMFGYNYFWASQKAEQIPKRLDENGDHITDFHGFKNQTVPFADSLFALPSYCSQDKPTDCRSDSICAKFKPKKNIVQ